jgi:hypothetical protein
LGLRRGAVDLVGQQHLGENRPGVEHEAVFLALVDRDAGDVGRQQVAGKLHPVEFEAERNGQRVRQRGLADPGHVFDQQVAAGQQAGQRLANLQILADHDLADLACYRVHFFKHGPVFFEEEGVLKPATTLKPNEKMSWRVRLSPFGHFSSAITTS